MRVDMKIEHVSETDMKAQKLVLLRSEAEVRGSGLEEASLPLLVCGADMP